MMSPTKPATTTSSSLLLITVFRRFRSFFISLYINMWLKKQSLWPSLRPSSLLQMKLNERIAILIWISTGCVSYPRNLDCYKAWSRGRATQWPQTPKKQKEIIWVSKRQSNVINLKEVRVCLAKWSFDFSYIFSK